MSSAATVLIYPYVSVATAFYLSLIPRRNVVWCCAQKKTIIPL